MGNKLTYYDRQQIALLHRIGLNAKRIAEKIGKDRTVVWRELKRNAGCYMPYEANSAHYFAKRRARKTNRPILEKDLALHKYVVEKLEKDWSPEQIAGRIKNHPPKHLVGKKISHETIYQFIYNKEPWLYHKLRRAHPDRQPRYQRKKRRTFIPDKVPIGLRPDEINDRLEIGHFESDSMIGKGHKYGLSAQYERSIHLARLNKIDNFSGDETNNALRITVESLPDGFVKSFTFDNGSENAKHKEVRDDYSLQTYFCDPYRPWQKGGVENIIGLVRHYFPKGTDLTNVTKEQINQVEELLNNRPRKSLDFKTPNELLIEYKQNSKMLH
jgi:IS30 family transposase